MVQSAVRLATLGTLDGDSKLPAKRVRLATLGTFDGDSEPPAKHPREVVPRSPEVIEVESQVEAKRTPRLEVCDFFSRDSEHCAVEQWFVYKARNRYNRKPGAIAWFIGAFKCAGDARKVHPWEPDNPSFSALEYETLDLDQRKQEWLEKMGDGAGETPGWFMGANSVWINGAYVDLVEMSVYVPPAGAKPEFGIWSVHWY